MTVPECDRIGARRSDFRRRSPGERYRREYPASSGWSDSRGVRWCERKEKGEARTETGSGGLRPFAPAVSMEPIRLETAPKCGSADAEMLGRLRELPVVGVKRLDDSLFFPSRQRGWTFDAGDEHRFAELEGPDAERTQTTTESGQPRLEIREPSAKSIPSSASRACWFAYNRRPSRSKTTTPSLNPSRSALASGENTDGIELSGSVSGMAELRNQGTRGFKCGRAGPDLSPII